MNTTFLGGKKADDGSGGNVYSAWSEVRCGVPQGSVLGLMHFVCYTIYDLPDAVASCLNS